MQTIQIIICLFIIPVFAMNAFAHTSKTTGGNWNNCLTWTDETVPPTGDNVTISSSSTVTLDINVSVGTLALNGVLSVSNYTLTINGNITGTGTLTTLPGSRSSKIIIAGSGDIGTLYFTGGTGTIYGLIMTSGNIILGNNLQVINSLTLTSGKIFTGSNKLTLGSISSLPTSGNLLPTSPTSSSYIVGNFERWFKYGATTSAIYFPVGTFAKYRPLIIQFDIAPTVSGTLKVSANDSDPGRTNPTDHLDDVPAYVVDRYSKEAWWKVTPENGLSGGTYSISLGAYDISGVDGVKFTFLRVLKRANSSSDWTLLGSHSPATGNSVNPLVKRTGLSGFSEFGIGGYSLDGNNLNNAPLPVSLKSFASSVSGNEVKLNWVTSSEINNKGFDIERTGINNSGNSNWDKIGFVGSKGSQNAGASYVFYDKNLQSGKYKYRLKQTDYNGNYEYFGLEGEVVIGAPKKINLSQNYPNPFNPVTTINYSLPEKSDVILKIFDIRGREIESLVNGPKDAGYYSAEFRTDRIASGIYFYTLTAGNYTETKRMTVIK